MEILAIKRQSAVLEPYNSAGEFYFQRGAGITLHKGKAEITLFASFRRQSANLEIDSVDKSKSISSFLNSGYHRTVIENTNRNNSTQKTFGGNIAWKNDHWQAGANAVYYFFSLPVQKRDEPYNLYAIRGKNWYNVSIDYSYTHKNFHFFGEAAGDKNLNKAFLNGLLVSVDPRVDLSFVQRTISPAYQSVNGNSFTENTNPGNENGFYAGITIRPGRSWQVDAYGDLYKFPWLKYLVDAPSHGSDFMVQLTFAPNKQVELYSRFRNELREDNETTASATTNKLVPVLQQHWRTQISYKINKVITLRNRIELSFYNNNSVNEEKGFLIFSDLICKPMLAPYSGFIRIQYVETGGYNSRIYAYENDIMYSYSIPAAYDKGFRYYITFNYELGKRLSTWLRWAQSIYQGKESIGSGLDEIAGHSKTEVKLQLRLIF